MQPHADSMSLGSTIEILKAYINNLKNLDSCDEDICKLIYLLECSLSYLILYNDSVKCLENIMGALEVLSLSSLRVDIPPQ